MLVGIHSFGDGEFLPGTTFGPGGEPAGPLSDTSIADVGHAAGQVALYEEVEDLQPDLSKADPAVAEES